MMRSQHMRSAFLRVATSGAILCAGALFFLPRAFAKDSTPSAAVVELFRDALAADAKGDREQREILLHKALELDPNYELARWYSGQVLYNGKWQDIAEIGKRVRNDPRQAEYHELLSESDDSAQSHVELAHWCQQANLNYEEKWHWLHVLAADAANREALGRLGVRLVNGLYLTPEEIETQKSAKLQAEKDFDRYSKQFSAWITENARGDTTARRELSQSVSQVHDVAALPALVHIFFLDHKSERRIRGKLHGEEADAYVVQVREAALNALSSMPEHDATLLLLEIALNSQDKSLAQTAAASLRYRRKTDYMPYLMQAMSSPIESAVSLRVSPSGQFQVHEDLVEKQPLAENRYSRLSKFLTQHVETKTEGTGIRVGPRGRELERTRVTRVWSDRQTDYSNAVAQVASTRERIRATNSIREANNARVQYILQIVTGENLGPEPSAWWDAWNQYNELNTPEELPVNQTNEVYDYSQNYVQNYRDPALVQTHSCFVAGTPVWTQAGKVAIETVKVGDLVLSQDPFTGELDYRPVMETSIGPPSPILNLKIENETLSTTRGHRFWIPNQGWEMAKFLKQGNRVLTLDGSAELHKIEKVKDQEAYNLVVGQFHTYFVGEQRVLVHDKNCPLPNLDILPGVDSEQVELSPIATTASN